MIRFSESCEIVLNPACMHQDKFNDDKILSGQHSHKCREVGGVARMKIKSRQIFPPLSLLFLSLLSLFSP